MKMDIAAIYLKRVLATVPTSFITVKRIPGGGILLTPKPIKESNKAEKVKL